MKIVATQSIDAWLEDYCRLAISSEAPEPPPLNQRIGACVASWEELDPGVAAIHVSGGTPLDRLFAETVLREELAGHGIEQAEFSLDIDGTRLAGVHLSNWQDVEAKARRLIRDQKVQLIRNGAQHVVGQVQGDHGNYQTELSRQDPNNQSISTWSCECPWGSTFAWNRTRLWKKYEARCCSHLLATYWLSKSIPTDEERAPGDQGQQGQMSLFDTGSGGSAPSSMGLMRAPMGTPGMIPASPQLGLPGMMPPMPGGGLSEPQGPPPGVGGMPPGQAPRELLPQFPGAPEIQPPVNPVSVPGGKVPSPLNPMQSPSGTFSSVGWRLDSGNDTMQPMAQSYQNGDMVQLRQDEPMAQWVGLNGGGTTTVPAGSVGEVRGTDPLGLVEVYFAGPAGQNGKLQPHGTSAWLWPSQIRPSDALPPGPATRRRSSRP